VPLRPRHGYAADLHRGLPADNTSQLRSHQNTLPCPDVRRVHPLSARFEVGTALKGLYDTGSSRTPSRLAHQTRPVWQYQAVLTSSGLLPALPSTSRVRLPPASTGRCDDRQAKVSHLHSIQVRSVRGALPVLPPVGLPEPPPEPGVHR